jgi:hypothetical protein
MSAPEFQAFGAIAFQLAATLDRYRNDVAAMVQARHDPDLYRRVSAHVDEMRQYAAALPPVSVAWVEVLIRHFELTHGLWRAQRDPQGVPLAQLHAQLRAAAERLERQCTQLMSTA